MYRDKWCLFKELFNCLLFPLFLLLIPFWKISSNTQHNLAKFSLSSVTTMFFVLNSRTNPAKYKNIYDSNIDLLQKSDWCSIARSTTIRSTNGVSPFYVQLNICVLHHCQREQLMHEVMHEFIYLYPPRNLPHRACNWVLTYLSKFLAMGHWLT